MVSAVVARGSEFRTRLGADRLAAEQLHPPGSAALRRVLLATRIGPSSRMRRAQALELDSHAVAGYPEEHRPRTIADQSRRLLQHHRRAGI